MKELIWPLAAVAALSLAPRAEAAKPGPAADAAAAPVHEKKDKHESKHHGAGADGGEKPAGGAHAGKKKHHSAGAEGHAGHGKHARKGGGAHKKSGPVSSVMSLFGGGKKHGPKAEKTAVHANAPAGGDKGALAAKAEGKQPEVKSALAKEEPKPAGESKPGEAKTGEPSVEAKPAAAVEGKAPEEAKAAEAAPGVAPEAAEAPKVE